MSGGQNIILRQGTQEEILPLRLEILVHPTGRTIDDYPFHEERNAFFYGAFDESRIVACATLLRREWEGKDAWQLRGMGTHPSVRGTGVGRALLTLVEEEARRLGPPFLFWCNARAEAVGFYERCGWTLVPGAFDVPKVGPHFKMLKVLPGKPGGITD